LLFGVGVYHFKSSQLLPLVHSHIQITFKTGTKSAVGGIKLVAANPQVGKNAVYLSYFMQPQKTLQVPEIVLNKNDTIIIGHIITGICILVKNNQPPFGVKQFQYFQGMSTATKGTINIHPIGANAQSVDHFLQ
jgi:hypothetical protein